MWGKAFNEDDLLNPKNLRTNTALSWALRITSR